MASGAYLGPCRTEEAAEFAQERHRPLDVVLDTLDMSSWDLMEEPAWWTRCWADEDRWLVLSVPMVFTPADSLEAGARGAYDERFETLARNLVAGGKGRAGLRPGWEFNGGWFPWAAAENPAAFAEYFRRVVQVMRSVPGADFTFIWNPDLGYEEFPAELAWPGVDVVDVIGLDVYDVSWSDGSYPYARADTAARTQAQIVAWDELQDGNHGLTFWTDFAAAQGVPLALPEWGLVDRHDGHGGGDNPYFVEQIRQWVDTHPVAFEIYFHAEGQLGEHRLSEATFPAATATYRRLFGCTDAQSHCPA